MIAENAEFMQINPQLEIEQGLKPILSDLMAVGTVTASRIREKVQDQGDNPRLRPYFNPLLFDQDLFMTDRPDRVFGDHSKWYTITSSLALSRNVSDGGIFLLPAQQLNASEKNLPTHRGKGLAIFERLVSHLGFNTETKSSFVWSGSEVDAEQFVIEDSIGQIGTEVDEMILSLIFNKSKDEFNPDFRNLLDSLNKRRRSEPIDSSVVDYANKVMTTLHETMGTRGGWFNALEKILNGTTILDEDVDVDNMQSTLCYSFNELGVAVPEKSQAVVVEIDTAIHFKNNPLYPFPLSSRPPGSLFPAPSIQLNAVTAFYTESDLDISLSRVAPVMNISELSDQNFLQNALEEHVTPAMVRAIGVDRRNPLCGLRYKGDPIDTWAGLILAGDIAPMHLGRSMVELVQPISYREHAFRAAVLKSCESAGLLGKIAQMTGSRDAAEKRILSAAENMFHLPSIIE